MITTSLAIGAASGAIVDPAWVRFAQPELTSDTATVRETADLLDELYQLDPCSAEESDSDEAGNLEEAAKKTLSLAICDSDGNGTISLLVQLYRSHPALPYTLRVAGGRILGQPLRQQLDISRVTTVEQASSLTLDVPVVDAFAASWIGTAVDDSGEEVASPSIHRSGNTLWWQPAVTGTLQWSCVSEVEQLSVQVDGVRGELGQATVRCFYQGDCTTYQVVMPDPAELDGSLCGSTTWQVRDESTQVECYEIVEHRTRCSCSGAEGERRTFERVVPCPDWAPSKCPGTLTSCRHLLGTVAEEEYTDCADDTGYAVNDREFYKDQCCEYPSATLPRCEEHTESYSGGKPIEHGEAFWKSLYGELTRCIPVSPEGGCGKHITRQIVEAESCCDTILPLTWDAANSIDTLQANDDGYVYVLDGLGPFHWRITSTSGYVWFRDSGSSTLVTDEATRWAALVSGDYPCGTYTIEVTDDCGTTVSGELVSAYGTWVLRYNTADHSQRWDISDIPGIPFSAPESFGFESISWGGAEAYSRGVYVVIASGATKTKYLQAVGVDRINTASLSVCFDSDSCPVDPGSYGASFALPGIGPDTTYLGAACGQAIASTEFDCRSRVYDPDWAALVSAITCGPSSMSTLTTISGDFALAVYPQTVADNTCPSGQRCEADIYVKTFLYPVEIYDWDC